MNLVINTDLIKQYINNNEVDAIIFDGTSLDSLVIDGIELWTASLFKYELFDDGAYELISSKASLSGSVEVPSTYNDIAVTRIGSDAFGSRTGITSIILPDTITYIDYEAFYGCTNMTSINIPESVEFIHSDAFYNCTSLTVNFSYPYWTTYDYGDGSISGYVDYDNSYGNSVSYENYPEETVLTKFYAPEIAMTHYEDSYVDVTVKNYNNESLKVKVYFSTDENWSFYETATVPANGTTIVTLDYSSYSNGEAGFDAFSVHANFDVLTNARSNEIEEEYSYWPQEDTTT